MDDKLKAWQLHYPKLLNVEFLWTDEPPVDGPAIKITTDGAYGNHQNEFWQSCSNLKYYHRDH